jgi:hypothetical protein
VNYELSQHARDVMAEREISIAWMERVLDHPQLVQLDRNAAQIEHRLGRVAEFGDRVLRVLVNKAASPPRVVSVYFDRTMRSKL